MGSENLDRSGSTAYPASITNFQVDGSWSPNGQQVAYYGGSDGGIYVMNADGSGSREVSVPDNPLYYLGTVSWLPDGRHVVWSDQTGQIWETDVSLGVSVPIAPGKLATNPVVSPNGKYIAYLPWSFQSTASTSQLRVMNLSGTGDHAVATSPLPSSDNPFGQVSWAPSGNQLAFQWGSNIATVDASGSRLQTVASGLAPVWSPDGKQILIDAPGGPELINPDGSNPTPIALGFVALDWQPTR